MNENTERNTVLHLPFGHSDVLYTSNHMDVKALI
jgi:hypothetical protein